MAKLWPSYAYVCMGKHTLVVEDMKILSHITETGILLADIPALLLIFWEDAYSIKFSHIAGQNKD